MLISTALALLMIPGFGSVDNSSQNIISSPKFNPSFFYSGLVRRKSALSLLLLSLMSTAVVTFQWFLWGYSLTFSHEAGSFIGNLSGFVLLNVLAEPSVANPIIPNLLFCGYHGMLAAVTYVSQSCRS